MVEFAVEWLTGLFGTDVKKALGRTQVTQWNKEPWTLGAFASASPGGQCARRVLMEPVRGRVFFAGEAVHETAWGTVGGAWESGVRAADAVVRRFGSARAEGDEPAKAERSRKKPRRGGKRSLARPKALIAWSSGKDSAWALHEVRRAGEVEVVGALTTVTDAFGRVSIHGLREELLLRATRRLRVAARRWCGFRIRVRTKSTRREMAAAMAAGQGAGHHPCRVRRSVSAGRPRLSRAAACADRHHAAVSAVAAADRCAGAGDDRGRRRCAARRGRSEKAAGALRRTPLRSRAARRIASRASIRAARTASFIRSSRPARCCGIAIAVTRGETVERDGMAYADLVPATPRGASRSLSHSDDGLGDVLGGLAGRAAHVVAVGIDPRRLRVAVLHQQIDVGDRRLIVELAVDAEQRRRRLVEQPHRLERQRRARRRGTPRACSSPMARPRASSRLAAPNR